MPVRKQFGTTGQEIVVRTNFLPIKLPQLPILEYTATFKPQADHKRVRLRLFELLLNDPFFAAFKGKLANDSGEKLYSPTPLPIAEGQEAVLKVQYTDPDDEQLSKKRDPKEYEVRVRFLRAHNPADIQRYLSGDPACKNDDIAPTLAAYNVILGQTPLLAGGVRIGGKSGRENKYFFQDRTTQQQMSLGGGIEAWKGFFLSVRPTFSALMANVNTAAMAFYSAGNLRDRLADFRRDNPAGNPDAFVFGLRVRTTHIGYIRTVRKIVRQRAHEYMFDCEGQQISVAQFFKQKYPGVLKDQRSECVDVGRPGKPIVVPVELCEILPGQSYRSRLTGNQTSVMLKIACRPPATNARQIMTEGVKKLGLDNNSPVNKAFGFGFGTELATVPGRVLRPPAVQYAKGPAKVNDKASWNLRGVKFALAGAKVEPWSMVILREAGHAPVPDDVLARLAETFASTVRGYGLQISTCQGRIPVELEPRNPTDRIRARSIEKIRTTIAAATAAARPKFILVLLANDDSQIYGGIKQLFDTRLGVHTICAQIPKILKEMGQDQYLANLSLKLNAKFGGRNHSLGPEALRVLNSKPTMLVGIDVTHPSPDSEKGSPSVAAVVASIDKEFAQFPTGLRLQAGTKEMVFTELTEMMKERLVLFRDKNRVLPQRIIVFRDGVSEGQFAQVIAQELPSIRKACNAMQTGGQTYKPLITIVICAKRHQTRFFATEQDVGGDDKGNTRPGTVVDQGVTTVYGQDFFLQAHHALQGSAKPTHYYPIYDDNNFAANDLQEVINALSYSFARATKAVSLVTPAYYADLACERGRCYLRKFLGGVRDEGETVSSSNVKEEVVYDRAVKEWANGVHNNIKNTMFYL